MNGRPQSLTPNDAPMTIGVKVFTATKAKEREALGDIVTKWLADNPHVRVVGWAVTQSSDWRFHCLSITLVYEWSPS
jgi:hypothetical protein